MSRAGNARGANYYQLSQAGFRAIHTPIYYAYRMRDTQFKGGAWSPERVIHFGPTITSVKDAGRPGGAVRITMTASPFDVTALDSHLRVQHLRARELGGARRAGGARGDGGRRSSRALRGRRARHGHRGRSPLRRSRRGAVGRTSSRHVGNRRDFAAYQGGTYTVRVNTVADSGATGPNWSVYVASAI